MRNLLFLVLACFTFEVYGQINNQAINFRKKEIQVGKSKLIVELAQTDSERALGLMHRKSMPAGYGMLFIFNEEKKLNFWMKNTFIPLSIGFFNKNKVLVDIQDMTPVRSADQTDIPSYESKAPAQYALEVNRGWFKTNKIKLGDKIKID